MACCFCNGDEEARMMKIKTILCSLVCSLTLVACGNEQQRAEIQPAKKLSNDATGVANEAWVLMNQLDQAVYANQQDTFEDIRKDLRELTNRWKVEIKMTDSVTEGKYAMCRKSMQSLDIWIRGIQENANNIAAKQADYERDKALCKDAIDHPELGNTSPKREFKQADVSNTQ